MAGRPDIEVDAQSGEIRIYDSWLKLLAAYVQMQIFTWYQEIIYWTLGFVWLSRPGIREPRFSAVFGHTQCLYRRLRERGPALVLTREGFEDRSTSLGVIPWRYLGAYRGELFWIRRPTLCLYRDGIAAWIEAMPEKAWVLEEVEHNLGDLKDYGLPIIQSGDGSLPLGMDDLLWLIGCYAQADGLPEGYQPKHPALIGLNTRSR